MKLTWIYILSASLILAACASAKPASPSESEEDVEDETVRDALVSLDDLEDDTNDLPILPPIILIDFTNGTNSTADEKSKRTINGNLGYGFEQNKLFSGKYNYYFPAGKTGTTVSIEESISPFQPKTITENVKPIAEQQDGSKLQNVQNVYTGTLRHNVFSGVANRQPQQQGQGNNVQSYNTKTQVFGQRTKLQKTTPQTFPSTPKPAFDSYSTPKSNLLSNSYPTGSNVESYSFTTPIPTYKGFSTPRPPTSHPSYNILNSNENSAGNAYNLGYNPISYQGSSTPRPSADYSSSNVGSGYNPGSTVLSPLGIGPRFTYENGVKYEHKIVWKYPDGKVSEIGPNSELNPYSGYSAPARTALPSVYQSLSPESVNRGALGGGYSVTSGNIYSQRPATFPRDPANFNYPSRDNQFVTAAPLSAGDYNVPSNLNQPLSETRFGGQYPNQYRNQNQYASTNEREVYKSSSYGGPQQVFGPTSYGAQSVVSPYPVNSPDPEYRNPAQRRPSNTGSSSGTSLYTRTGQVSPKILSKYTPQVQKYLMKALALGPNTETQTHDNFNAGSYSNLQYSNLLNYNPSISQYIRNPASILNAQPTFIQAGNSLIPVIILRVDGAPPVQPNVTPNVNLKALLQQYLTHYAQSVNELAQSQNPGQTYDPVLSGSGPDRLTSQYGKDQNTGSPLFDLDQLTQSLSQLRRNQSFGHNVAQSFAQNVAQRSQVYDPSAFPTGAGYNSLKKSDNLDNGYGSSASQGIRKKVKSVQIIEDPRFGTHQGDKS